MYDPRQSLKIIDSDSELTVRIGQLARLFGYTHWQKYTDPCTDDMVFRFSVLRNEVWKYQQVQIPCYNLTTYHIAMPVHHTIWLELIARLREPNTK